MNLFARHSSKNPCWGRVQVSVSGPSDPCAGDSRRVRREIRQAGLTRLGSTLDTNDRRRRSRAISKRGVTPDWTTARPTADRQSLESKTSGGAGSRIPPSDVGFDRSRSVSDGCLVGDGGTLARTESVSIGVDLSTGRNVESRTSTVHDDLFAALSQWIRAPDVRALRRALLAILSALE